MFVANRAERTNGGHNHPSTLTSCCQSRNDNPVVLHQARHLYAATAIMQFDTLPKKISLHFPTAFRNLEKRLLYRFGFSGCYSLRNVRHLPLSRELSNGCRRKGIDARKINNSKAKSNEGGMLCLLDRG